MATSVVLDDRVKELICQVSCCQDEECTSNSELRADLGMDSLDITELTMELEEKLLEDGEIDERVADKWVTVSDVVASMREIMATKPKASAGRKKR